MCRRQRTADHAILVDRRLDHLKGAKQSLSRMRRAQLPRLRDEQVELDDPAAAVAGIILKSSYQRPGRVEEHGPPQIFNRSRTDGGTARY